LPIGALEEADCASLAAHFGRDEIDPNGLLRATGGNPLYLVELLRAEPGTSARRVQDLLRSRLETTPELERQTLEALAVLGNAVGLPAIKQTAGRSLDESLTALEGLRTAALVIEDATGFRFHHDLTRELVLEDLYPARAGLLNLRAAKARADTPILAANHYWAAKDLLEQEDATQAGQAFLHVASVHAVGNDLEVGLQWFDRASEMARDGQEQIRVLVEKARMLMLYRRYDLTEDVLALAERLDDESHPLTTVRVLNSRASYAMGRSNDTDFVLQLSKQAMTLLERDSIADNSERAETLSNIGVAYEALFEIEHAKTYLEQALALHRQIGDRVKIGKSLRALGWLMARQGDSKAEAILNEEIQLWTDMGNKQSVVYAYNHLGVYWLNLEKYIQAETCFLKSIELAMQERIEHLIGLTYNNLGAVYFHTQKFDQAEHFYRKAKDIADAEQNQFRLALVLGNLAELFMYKHQPSDARSYTIQGRAVLNGTPHDAKLADLAWFEAETYVLEHDMLQARICFLESAALAQKAHHKSRLAQANSRLARLNADPELAQQAFDLLESTDTRAALQAIQGQSEVALETIRSLNDPYEEYRLLLDLERLTGDTQFTVLAEQVRTVFRVV
jgi:tetratricopeptide (TPR) repeat protein